MKIKERDVIQFFNKYRALDGYIGIFNFVTHYNILATYHDWLYIFSLSSGKIITISLIYHGRPSKYPRLHFVFSIGKHTFIDNGKSAAEYYRTSYDAYMARKKQEKQETKDRLNTVKQVVQDATFGQVECGIALETIRENIDGVEIE